MEAAYSGSSNSSPEKTATKLTLFDGLLRTSQSGNSNSGDGYPSDCESVVSGEENQPKHETGLIMKIHEGGKVFEIIKNKLVSSLSSHGLTAQVEAIDQSDYSSCIMKQVKYRSFSLYSRGMAIQRNGDANVKYAWYGATKDELNSILAHGFSLPPGSSPPGLYGSGVYLSPVDHPVNSLQSAVADENGIRHMLLCRVILGKTEVIRPGSGQYKPSSEEFDSGVDNLMFPNKYIIWNGDMNTHILPEFTVSFRSSSSTRSCKCEVIRQKVPQPPSVPTSEWMPFASLIRDLARFLPRDAVEQISKHHSEFRKQKITRKELIHRVRNIAGDKLLMTIIKSCRNSRSMHTGAAAKVAM